MCSSDLETEMADEKRFEFGKGPFPCPECKIGWYNIDDATGCCFVDDFASEVGVKIDYFVADIQKAYPKKSKTDRKSVV